MSGLTAFELLRNSVRLHDIAFAATPIVLLEVIRRGAVTIRDICRDLLYGRGARCFVCPAANRDIWGPSSIPNDYSSTTTIPKLNFRFLERAVTMQETYADRCCGGPVGGRARMDDEVSKGRP